MDCLLGEQAETKASVVFRLREHLQKLCLVHYLQYLDTKARNTDDNPFFCHFNVNIFNNWLIQASSYAFR